MLKIFVRDLAQGFKCLRSYADYECVLTFSHFAQKRFIGFYCIFFDMSICALSTNHNASHAEELEQGYLWPQPPRLLCFDAFVALGAGSQYLLDQSYACVLMSLRLRVSKHRGLQSNVLPSYPLAHG